MKSISMKNAIRHLNNDQNSVVKNLIKSIK